MVLRMTTNALQTVHPSYSIFSEDWKLMRDCYRGQRVIKHEGTIYLPATSSMIADGQGKGAEQPGQKAYDAYRKRARFPNFTREAIQMAIGMMHSQPPEIKLPKALEKIISSRGESLPILLRRINLEQLLMGRIGCMVDLPTNPAPGEDMPYLTTYATERLINWDDGTTDQLVPQNLNMVVLNESENERRNVFQWELETKYRVMIIGDDDRNEERGVYRQGVFRDEGYNESQLVTPSWRGRTLEKIPFVIINSADLVSSPDDPPLLDLGNLCIQIYQGEADYRQNLFMQGQDTFVTVGGGFDEDEKVRIGSGAHIDLPMGGKAEYVGVNGNGLSEQRESLGRLEARAGSMGAQTLDSTSRERESGDSLRIRVAARTADMNQIVDTGAAGLEHALRIAAEWIGEDPDEVEIKPNKEFGEMPLTGQTMVEMATARAQGFPISAKTLHDVARKRRVTTLTFEEEVAQAKIEDGIEDFPFEIPENGDRNPDQVQPGDGGDATSTSGEDS